MREPNANITESWGPKYKGMVEDLVSEGLEVAVAKQVYHCSTSVLEYSKSDPNTILVTYEDLILDPTVRENLLKYCGLETVGDYRKKLADFDQAIDKRNLCKWTQNSVDNTKVSEILSQAAKKLGYSED